MFTIFSIWSVRNKGHYLAGMVNLESFKKLDRLLLEIYPTVLNDIVFSSFFIFNFCVLYGSFYFFETT